MSVWLFLAAAVAGGLGAATRFALDSSIINKFHLNFPWTTFAINVSGSLALGFLASLAAGALVPEGMLLLLGTGFLGGYTTFSTTSFDTVRLLQEKRHLASLANAMGSLAAGVGAAALGYWCGSLF
ncbi:CrcB protein [Arthrobacter stackebrandtii]|uniref:Fluoride-specific ion channel FluC n=1 Tax=Arthrobacter stackebrandtii TaxID=272161 RepID=A0ABS4Z202_9MICC|nr:fluoride efflux transporter CrcB [Arthrobacter stackebrandtii]MBP2415011.1 CrcB protein [Arthrobacter stackebrandtii]PYH00836.1 fluoride efflux transporter CrcB [Arthrobacter stackebrandtii]